MEENGEIFSKRLAVLMCLVSCLMRINLPWESNVKHDDE